jgi:hypothetical protein
MNTYSRCRSWLCRWVSGRSHRLWISSRGRVPSPSLLHGRSEVWKVRKGNESAVVDERDVN